MSDDQPPSEAAWQHYADMLFLGDRAHLDKVRSGWKAGYEAGWHERGSFESGAVKLHRRSPADQLRYLADQLDAGQNPLVVGVALTMLAEKLVETAEQVAPPPDPV